MVFVSWLMDEGVNFVIYGSGGAISGSRQRRMELVMIKGSWWLVMYRDPIPTP